MPSIDNRKIVEQIIANDGYYPDKHDIDRDPQVQYIHEYTTLWNGLCFHISYDRRQLEAFLSSLACRNRREIWTAQAGLTGTLSDRK